MNRAAIAAALFATITSTLCGQTDFLLGTCTHFSGGKGQLGLDIRLIRQAGFSSVREDFPWNEVEREKGKLVIPPAFDDIANRIVAAGLQPLIILDYGNPFYDHGDKPTSDEAITAYGRYAEFVVHHFKGRVKFYEVWNEWGGTTGGTHHGTPEAYVKLLIPTVARMKAVDSSITILGGAVSSQDLHGGWLKGMLAAGGGKYVDGISIHPYTYYQEDPAKRTPDAWKAFVTETENDIHTMTGRADFPLYITEMGWPTDTGAKGTDKELAADYLAQTLLMARSMPFVKGFWKYDFRDDGTNRQDPEHNFGLVTNDSQPKPGYTALKSISEVIKTATFLGPVKDEADPDLQGVRFRTADGRTGAAVWNRNPNGPEKTVKVEKLKIETAKAETRIVGKASDQPGSAEKKESVKVERTPTLVLNSK